MAKVPYDPLTRVRSRAVSPVFQDAGAVPSGAFDSGGAGLVEGGRMIAGFGDEIGRIALQMQQEDNETAAKEADARISDRVRRIVYGGKNEAGEYTPGYMQTRQSDALNTYGDAEEAIRAAIQEEIEASKDNRQLTGLIQTKSQQTIDSALDRMTVHAGQERLAHQEGVSLAREAQAYENALADPYNPDMLRKSLGTVQAEVLDRAEANGLSDEQTEVLLQERQSVVVQGVFDAYMTAEDIEASQRLFNQYADRISPAVRQQMAQSLAQNVRVVTAQRVAREIFEKHPNDPIAGMKAIDDLLDGSAQTAATEGYQNYINTARSNHRFGKELQAEQRAELERSRPARVQEMVDAILDSNPDASPEELRQIIRDTAGYGGDRTAALALFEQDLSRTRGDTATGRTDAAYSNFEEATNLVESWIREGAGRDEIRGRLLDIEDPRLQAAATAFFSEQLAGNRSDIAEDRVIDDEATLEKAADISDQIFGSDEIRSIGDVGERYEAMRNALVDRTKGDADLRAAAWQALSARINAEQGDEAYLRSLGAEARAEYNHMRNMDAHQREEAIREARVEAYDWLYGGGTAGADGTVTDRTLRAFRASNKEAYETLARAGLIDNLVVTERHIAEGRLFANVTDGETLPNLILLEPNQLAKVNPILYRQQLTETEYSQLTRAVASAQSAMAGEERNPSVMNFGRSELQRFAPEFIKPNSDAPKHKKAYSDVVSAMYEWLRGQERRPTNAEITTQAARLMLELRADVDAGGIAGFFGAGNLGSGTLVAAMRRDLTPAQRAVVTVDIDDINEAARQGISRYASQRWSGVPQGGVTDEMLEELAGAWAVDDRDRFDRLMREAGAVPRGTQ